MIKNYRLVQNWYAGLVKSQATSTPPPNSTSIQGHCMGVVGRAWRGVPAGYASAHDCMVAVQKAGKLRSTKPPSLAVGFYIGGQYGHVVTTVSRDRVWTSDLPNTGRIGLVKRLYVTQRWTGLRWGGWCYPSDIPGWK